MNEPWTIRSPGSRPAGRLGDQRGGRDRHVQGGRHPGRGAGRVPRPLRRPGAGRRPAGRGSSPPAPTTVRCTASRFGIKDIITTLEGPTTAQEPDPGSVVGRSGRTAGRRPPPGGRRRHHRQDLHHGVRLRDARLRQSRSRSPATRGTPRRWPGGSSSGTGSGVAAGMFLGGLGTDTGGSIRCPASFSGISGMKQTYGLVPKFGLHGAGHELRPHRPDGPVGVGLRRHAVGVIAGHDPSDRTSVMSHPVDYVMALDGASPDAAAGRHQDRRAQQRQHPRPQRRVDVGRLRGCGGDPARASARRPSRWRRRSTTSSTRPRCWACRPRPSPITATGWSSGGRTTGGRPGSPWPWGR